MHPGKHILFWITVFLVLVIGFGSSYGDYTTAFYFVSFLLPVAMATSYFFNYYLVPNYLFRQKYIRFSLYTCYTIIISLFLEMVVITISFAVLANYNYRQMNPLMSNIFVLASVLYLIVLFKAFVLIYLKLLSHEFRLQKLAKEKQALQTEFITVRANRTNYPVKLDEILYLESLGDYVKIHKPNRVITTKETLTFFETSLPDYFIRIHRSFIINRNHIIRFNATDVSVHNQELPISRTYKSEVLKKLDSDS